MDVRVSLGCRSAQDAWGGDLPLAFLWTPRRHGDFSLFRLASPDLVRWTYTGAGGPGTNHSEVPTHILFPLVAGQGKGGVRIAQMLPGSGRTAREMPSPFSGLFLPRFSFP